jgi:hypothetical protein
MKRLKAIIWYKIKKRLSKRRGIDLKRAFTELKENQRKILEITNFLLSNPSIKLIFSSFSHVYFIEYKDVICKIGDDGIVITNGLYSYDITINPVIIEDIRHRFLRHIESKKRSVERNIVQKLSNSLSKVHEQILGL